MEGFTVSKISPVQGWDGLKSWELKLKRRLCSSVGQEMELGWRDKECRTWGLYDKQLRLHGVWKCIQLDLRTLLPCSFVFSSRNANQQKNLVKEEHRANTAVDADVRTCQCTRHSLSFIIVIQVLNSNLTLKLKSQVRDLGHTMNSKLLTKDLDVSPIIGVGLTLTCRLRVLNSLSGFETRGAISQEPF